MANQIVTVNVSQRVAPEPSDLQKSGAFVSQGGTTLAAGATAFLTEEADLAAILAAVKPVHSLTWSGGVVTATTEQFAATGTYDSGTGVVTLTLTPTSTIEVGDSVVVSGATGTGDYADIDGARVAGASSGGATLKYTITTGLTMTITAATVNVAIGMTVSDTFLTTIAGATPATYNGEVLATVASSTTFTYPLTTDPGTSPATGTVTYTPRGVAELSANMNPVFFAQGSAQGVFVLELGAGEDAAAIAVLDAWITANPGEFYSYLVPKSWNAAATFVTLVNKYTANTAKTYFFTTLTAGTYASFAGIKSVVGHVESPDSPITEFSAAADFRATLNYAPSPTNKVTPLAFTYLQDVTAYPTKGNGATLTAFKAAGVNYVGTGAEGGISSEILFWGTTMDVRPFTYWYSVDWIQINTDLDVTNAVINGSNDPTNPLYYNQNGIDRLQDVGAATLSKAVSYGLANGTVTQTALSPTAFNDALDAGDFDGQLVINAVPYATWLAANPSDYKDQTYGGFTVVYVNQNGFIEIIFNIVVTDFVTT